MLLDIKDVRCVAWNADKGRILTELRGKKSRDQLKKDIEAIGGKSSRANLEKLEYGISQAVSVKVLQDICAALEIPLSRFVDIYFLGLPPAP